MHNQNKIREKGLYALKKFYIVIQSQSIIYDKFVNFYDN